MTEELTSLPDNLVEALSLLEGLPESERRARLVALCDEHPEHASRLRAWVADVEAAAAALRPDGEALPSTIGPYRVLERIGRGGMGDVYKAERREPVRQVVAVKIIKEGMATREVLARFDLERRALSAMNHRTIARVFDAGATDRGEPFFVMEYVAGLPLTAYCDKHKLSIDERLRTFQRICAGVHHAHLKGVVHRDLKPGNVLVVREGDEHLPKILDFGLAKATNHDFLAATVFTERQRVMGTPEYMAPEQAAGDGEVLDFRADVYSLGVILYELLAGELPFTSEELRRVGQLEALRLICQVEPARPSTKLTHQHARAGDVAARRQTTRDGLSRELRKDLDWVVMKAMAKEPERRYDSATALAEDIGRYLRHEPVLAGPPSAGYRLRKFVRRHRVPLAAAAAVALALTAGMSGVIWFWLEARSQAREARHQQTMAQEQSAAAQLERVRADTKAAEAVANAQEAAQKGSLLAAKIREFDHLAAVVGYEGILAAERELYPPWPSRVAAMELWLAKVHDLMSLRAELEKAVADLRQRTDCSTPAPPARAPDEVDLTPLDASRRFLQDTLVRLLADMTKLESIQRPAVEQRLAWARKVGALTRAHRRARKTWSEVRASLARADGVVASTLYAGMALELLEEDVVGLVPIGMNPRTLLWEFYDLRSAWDGKSDPAEIPIPMHFGAGDHVGEFAGGTPAGVVFVLLPGGASTMGSQATDEHLPYFDPQRFDSEALHHLQLAPFLISRFEMTQAQWERLTGQNPSLYLAPTSPGGAKSITLSNPVEQVDWLDADRWLRRHGMVLPTEAQWEYACRAGTSTPWSCSFADLKRHANLADATARALTSWTCETWADGDIVHAPVGSYLGNPFGLFDMHGNVWEWTRDGEHGPETPPAPGEGLRGDPERSSTRVVRGGSFLFNARVARSANRYAYAPTVRLSDVGLRAVRELPTR